MKSLLILGRQPALGLAELESLYGAAVVTPWGSTAALLDIPPAEVTFERLGGSIKACQVLSIVDSTDLRKIEYAMLKVIPSLADHLEDGKIQLGISAYGLQTNTQQLLATGLNLKKALRKAGKSVRLVPNKELELNSASVLHNNLTGDHGIEFVLVAHEGQTFIARTTDVQDIDSYTLRDRGRPKRDARVGMLPPKLAQIIINLTVAGQKPAKNFGVLDPFCGTGVILQETVLMGFSADGSDIDQRMGDYTLANLDWLQATFPGTENVPRGWQLGDATTHQWQTSKFTMDGGETIDAERIPMAITAVASETYLGKPFTAPPSPEILNQTVTDCNVIIKKFLRNIGSQIQPGVRLCLAVPAWQLRPGQFKHLPLLDSLEDMGYNRISFEHVRSEDLLYYRADQIVARELLVLVKL